MADEKENMTENDETQAEPEAEEPTTEASASGEEETEVVADATEGASPEESETPEEPEEPQAEPLAAEAAPAPEPEEEAPAATAVEAEPEAAAEEPAETAAPAAEVKKKKKRLPRSERSQRTKPKREKAAERKPITRISRPEPVRGRRQERQGTVVSAAADKTIVVRVDVVKVHPTYKKVIRRSTKFHAHDERNEAKRGDVVRIVETRPLSKLKRWRLQEIVEAAK
jgi:small subunit ribosomal protein S17